ncbi:mucin-3A-like [Helicoverpa zea]|uniref:mucin-3A-like n=1 Tax=Helicoverpa zea TaxID=7113 RepID=UPI001F560593|nr:mucin-3A-like [Helicoverpa zea]
MFRIKLSKMAFEMNDLKGILFLVLFAMPMVATLNINCHGKAFHCVNSTHFMICVDLGGGVSTTIDDFVIPCPATTVCHEENTFECDFPKIEVIPPLQVLGVYEQSDTSGKNLVTESVTIPTTTSDIISEFIENITATTLPTPKVVKPVLILEEHIQQPTQVDNRNTTDPGMQATSSFVNKTNNIANNNQTNINTIITSTVDYSSFDTVTETFTDNISDPITGATNLMSVLPENVTVTTSLPDVSTLNYLNANISPTNYQNKTQQITKQDGNAKNMSNTINIVPEVNGKKTVQNLTKSNFTTETLINSTTESVNISKSVSEAGIVQATTDMSSLGLVDLILGTQSTNPIMNIANNSTSNFDNDVTTVDPYTKQDTNDSGSTFSEAATPTETILTDMLISTEQISTTPSINTNLEALNNTDINYNSFTEFNFSDQITTTENLPKTTTQCFDLQQKKVSSTQRSTTPTYVEVSTTVDQTKEIISTKDLTIVFNNNSYQINTDKNQSLLSENNMSDVIKTTDTIKIHYGVSSTEPTLLLSTSVKHAAIDTPTAEKPPQVSQNEVPSHVIKLKNESSVTEGPYITINEPKKDIVQNDTILIIFTATVPNTVTEATLVTEDNTMFSTQLTEVISKSPVTGKTSLVNEPKQETVKNTTPVTIKTTKTTNDARSNSATDARDNFVLSTQFTEIANKPTQKTLENNIDTTINTIEIANDVMVNTATEAVDSSILPTQFTEVISKSPVTDKPTLANEPKQEIVENKTDVTMNPTDVSNNERTNSASEAVDYSMLSTQFIQVTNKSPVTDKPNTINESKRTTVENNSVLKTTASYDTKLTSITELLNISTLSANFAKVTNESRDAEPPNIVNEHKQERTGDMMKKYSDTEALSNSTFSVHFTGATNKSPVAEYISIRNGSNQDGAQNNKFIIIHTTTASGIFQKESVKDATYNSTFSNHFTITESPVIAYPYVVDEPKQETTENIKNTVLSASTTTAPNDIGTNSLKDDFTRFEHFIKETTELPATPYPHVINELKQHVVASDTLLTNYAMAPENARKELVKNATENNFDGVTTESTYSSNIAGRKQTIVDSSQLLIVHTTAPDILTTKSNTEFVDNSAYIAHSNVNQPKQESVKTSAISPVNTISANNYGTEPKVKDSTTVSDLVTNEPAGLIGENNTRIDHVRAKIGETYQENITTDFTNPPKHLETTTLGLFSTNNEPVATFQDAVATTTYKNNLKNSLTKLFPLKVADINKTDNIGFVNKDIGTAPNTAMNPDVSPIISLPEIPPLNKFVGAPTSSLPEIVDTVSKKDSTKVYEKLLMDGPQNADINGHSTTEYIPETSTTHAIDGIDYTNIKKISSFGMNTQSIISVTTETAFASLGTSVDWSASDKTDRVNTETVLSEISTKTDTGPTRYTTDKISSSTVINYIDKSIKIVSESNLVNSSNAIQSRKLEPSNLNPLLSPDYIKTIRPQDSSMYITTSDYNPADFTQVEQPVTKKFEVLQQKPTTIVDLFKPVTDTYTLPAVEEKTENIKRVSVTEATLPRNSVFKGINPTSQDFNYVTEKNNIYVSSQEPMLNKLNKIPKVDTEFSINNAMASTTILPKTFKTLVIRNNDMIITDASIFTSSSTPPVPVENNLKIYKELPISSSKPTETKTTEYYSVKPVLPITEVPFVKTTTVASQPSKIPTQTMPKSVSETDSDILKTTGFPKLLIQMENNKSTRSTKGKTTETVSLATEPDSMVETIKVEAIPNPVVSYTITNNNSTDGIKTGKSKIDHESIVIGNVYKTIGPSKTTDLKLLEDNSKVEAINPKSDWIKSDIDVDIAKIKETSIEDTTKSSGFASKSGPAIKTLLPIPTATVLVRPKVNQTADSIQLSSVAIHPTIATQIESTIPKTEPKPITKENQKTVTNAFITVNNKTSDGKLQFQEPVRNTTDSYHMNNAKANVTTSYHKLSLQNNTFNDDLTEHLISTNHTITTEVQNHLNESDKQSNKTNYSVTSNITSTHYQNNTALKINSGDKGYSISVSTPQVFSCLNRTRGKYSDKRDCRKFYTCIGNLQPMIGTCPNNTVFSEINKQCTRNLSHCVRNNQFRCLLGGRFSDFFKDNIYYICVKNNIHGFIRYKLKCQSGYHLNKATVKCEKDEEISIQSASSISEANNEESTTVKIKSDKITKTGFKCENEGNFPYDKDCKKYYVCTKIKSDYQWKIKKCPSDEVYDKKKKKCVDSDSGEC